MKTPSRTALIPLAAAAVLLTSIVPFARAQEAPTPAQPAAGAPAPGAASQPESAEVSPEVSALAPPAGAPIGNGTQVIPTVGPSAAAEPAGITPYRWGSVDVSPRILYQYLYGNSILARPGEPKNTSVQTIAPGVLFGLGAQWQLDYSPIWTLYSNSAFSDQVNHIASLTGSTAYEDWALRFSESFTSVSSPLVETGTQTRQKTSGTAFSATHSVGTRMLLELNFGFDARFPEGLPLSREWSTTDWLHYRLAPDWDGAVGIGLGYVDVSPGPNMTYERPQLRIGWKPTERIGFDLAGGMEIRHFNASGRSDLNSPIVSGTFHFQPVEATLLSLQVGRQVTTSYFAGQVTENTYWNASVRQRLLQVLFLTANYAHQRASYVAAQADVVAARADTFDSVDLRLGTTVLRRGTVSAIYRYTRNSSNLAEFGFSSHQVGFEIAYQF